MSIFGRLALLFVVVPILELALLIQMGRWVGFWPTLLLVLGTGVVGAALARIEGLRTLYAFQREVATGKIPGKSLFDGLAILVGGAFLLTPGLITDVAGFALLFPLTRGFIRRRVTASLKQRIRDGSIRVAVGGFGRAAGGWRKEADEPGNASPDYGSGNGSEARPEEGRIEIEVGRLEKDDARDP